MRQEIGEISRIDAEEDTELTLRPHWRPASGTARGW
jgi:hypothetical protein